MTRTKAKEIKTAYQNNKYGLRYLATRCVVLNELEALELAKTLFKNFIETKKPQSDYSINEFMERLNKFYFSGIKFDLQDLRN